MKFIAEHYKTGKKAEFEFVSLKQAKYFNSHFINWVEVGE